MSFDPALADIRFGCGLSPTIAPPRSATAMLEGLRADDDLARRYPIETFDRFLLRMQERAVLIRQRRDARGTPDFEKLQKTLRRLRGDARRDQLTWMASHIARRIETPFGFRERLEGFWGDHFTATGKIGIERSVTSTYTESAIRPHLAGRFETLLFEAVTHPVMLRYLDQDRSYGPNSAIAKKRKVGLNENLAREILELHTLGVDGPYSQTDVRQLAELLTGLTTGLKQGRVFNPNMAEPGAEEILGASYGGTPASLDDIRAVLRDLARHPATARHIAWKLAVHFVSDTADADMIAKMTDAYMDTEGHLPSVYEAMLTHPAAWAVAVPNMKPPFEFISSALRALAVEPKVLLGLSPGKFTKRIQQPLALMGHVWQTPNGPDGLEEADSTWITPQSMAARLQWAVAVPYFLQRNLPDPRVFVETALGPKATDAVRFAASSAERKADGIGLVLASPAFQRS